MQLSVNSKGASLSSSLDFEDKYERNAILLSGVPKLLNIVTGGGLNWHLIDIRASTRKRPNRPFSYPKVAELQMTGAYVFHFGRLQRFGSL